MLAGNYVNKVIWGGGSARQGCDGGWSLVTITSKAVIELSALQNSIYGDGRRAEKVQTHGQRFNQLCLRKEPPRETADTKDQCGSLVGRVPCPSSTGRRHRSSASGTFLHLTLGVSFKIKL